VQPVAAAATSGAWVAARICCFLGASRSAADFAALQAADALATSDALPGWRVELMQDVVILTQAGSVLGRSWLDAIGRHAGFQYRVLSILLRSAATTRRWLSDRRAQDGGS
jgi:hypothetical protein